MRVLLAGGGTAGHVNPAIAIAQILKQRSPDTVAEFVGKEDGIEHRLVSEAGYKFHPIKIYGFERKFSIKNFRSLYYAVKSVSDAKKMIRDFAPDIVIGTGGYVTWPLIRAAASMKVPSVLHESNAVPGMTVKLLSSKAEKIMINIPECAEHIKQKEKIVVTGNPLLSAFYKTDRDTARKKYGLKQGDRLIVSFGGSGGAEVLNKVCIDLMLNYASKDTKIHHIHACGKKYYPKMSEYYRSMSSADNERCVLKEYINDMPVLMTAADLIISRAGAMTISEISRCGRASILIPSPNVTGDHQKKNALAMQKEGAAEIIEEKDLNYDSLKSKVEEILKNDKKRAIMEERSGTALEKRPDEKIYKTIMEILSTKK